MKRLILMRHAKSDWSGGATGDHDRPLNARGRKSATGLGDWLRDGSFIPDQVLCSSAARTKETLARLGLPESAEVTLTRELYLASEDRILKHLQGASGDCVMVICHNPGVGVFADMIVKTPPEHGDFMGYPTGATLVADFDVDTWGAIRWGTGKVFDFAVPRDL